MTMAKEDSIGVVIPAYKPDAPVLREYIEEISEAIEPETIRVEIDCPESETVSRIEKAEAEIEISSSSNRRGKGKAVMDGFNDLSSDILVYADADGSVPASSLIEVIESIQNGSADASIGSRRHPSSDIVKHQTIIRRLLGNCFARAARRMLSVQCQDYQCGAKAVHAEAWSSIGEHCSKTGFAWDIEFLSLAESLDYEISEVPVEWDDHPESTVSTVSTSIELGKALLDLRRRTD